MRIYLINVEFHVQNIQSLLRFLILKVQPSLTHSYWFSTSTTTKNPKIGLGMIFYLGLAIHVQ